MTADGLFSRAPSVLFKEDATWPPPYMPTMARTLFSMRYSSQLFGAALLVCVLMTLMTMMTLMTADGSDAH